MSDCRVIGYAAQRVVTVDRLQSPVGGKFPAYLGVAGQPLETLFHFGTSPAISD
jgi:hypothetical protein